MQVGLVPISEKHLQYAEGVKARLEAAGLRVELDASNNKMQGKIRDFGLQKVPFILIMGDKESATDRSAYGYVPRAMRVPSRSTSSSRARRRWSRSIRWGSKFQAQWLAGTCNICAYRDLHQEESFQ